MSCTEMLAFGDIQSKGGRTKIRKFSILVNEVGRIGTE